MGLTFLGGIIIIGRDHHLWARLLFLSDIIILGHDYYNKMGLSSLDKIIFLGGVIFYFLILSYFFLLVYPLGQAIYIIWRMPLVISVIVFFLFIRDSLSKDFFIRLFTFEAKKGLGGAGKPLENLKKPLRLS